MEKHWKWENRRKVKKKIFWSEKIFFLHFFLTKIFPCTKNNLYKFFFFPNNSVDLRIVREIRKGRKTSNFHRFKVENEEAEKNSFSLVYGNSFEVKKFFFFEIYFFFSF